MESKKCVEIVEHLLEFVPKCRDNDIELIQEVWRRQSGFMYELDKQPIARLVEMFTDAGINIGGQRQAAIEATKYAKKVFKV